MSLFNMAAGFSPLVQLAMDMIGKTPKEFPRFRDAYVDFDNPSVVVMTRTGGGNREWYETPEEGPSNADIRAMPGYAGDWDDDFDRTFAYWRFSVDAEKMDELKKLVGAWSSRADQITAMFGEDFSSPFKKEFFTEKPMDRFKRRLDEMKK